MYFKSLVDILVNRAELIGAERRMMKVHRRGGGVRQRIDGATRIAVSVQ